MTPPNIPRGTSDNVLWFVSHLSKYSVVGCDYLLITIASIS